MDIIQYSNYAPILYPLNTYKCTYCATTGRPWQIQDRNKACKNCGAFEFKILVSFWKEIMG